MVEKNKCTEDKMGHYWIRKQILECAPCGEKKRINNYQCQDCKLYLPKGLATYHPYRYCEMVKAMRKGEKIGYLTTT